MFASRSHFLYRRSSSEFHERRLLFGWFNRLWRSETPEGEDAPPEKQEKPLERENIDSMRKGYRTEIPRALRNEIPPKQFQNKIVYYYDRSYMVQELFKGNWFLVQAGYGGTWVPLAWSQINPQHVHAEDSQHEPMPEVRELRDFDSMEIGDRKIWNLKAPRRLADGTILRPFGWVVTRLSKDTFRFEDGKSSPPEFSREDLEGSRAVTPHS